MARYHSDEEVGRYDLMKLGVLLLLLALLALTWLITRNSPAAESAGDEAAPTVVAENATAPIPTLGIPMVDTPGEELAPGSVPLSGSAGPGAQIIILVNGQPAGAATTGVDGKWSATLDLPAGDYVIQAQTVDNVGTVVGESEPVNVTVGSEASPGATAVLNSPAFDPVTGTYGFSGNVAAGETVTLTSNGIVVGTAVADEGGAWAIAVPADAISGDLQLQATDATGNVTQQSEPVKTGPRPPSLNPSGAMLVDPATGAASLPIQSGSFTWVGQGEPGTSVEMLVNGVRAGLAPVDVAGQWSLPVDLPAGTYTVQLNLLDPSGNVLVGTTPFTVVAGDGATMGGAETATTEPAATAPVETPSAAGDQTIAGLLATTPEFSSLWSVIETAGLAEALTEPGPFTVFAPTNDAFALLPQQVVDGLVANPQILSEVLQYHITRGRYSATDLLVVQPAMVNGRLLTILPQGNTLAVNDAIITTADIMAENGIVHAIDRILVPPLATGVRPPVIDESGVAVFTGTQLTIVGTAQPGSTMLVELNGEAFGQPAVVDPNGEWLVAGEVTPGDYQIVAYMLDASGALQAIARPVALQVN